MQVVFNINGTNKLTSTEKGEFFSVQRAVFIFYNLCEYTPLQWN